MKKLILLLLSMSMSITSHAGKIDKSKTCDCLGEDGYIYVNTAGVEGGCISKNSPSVNGTDFFIDSDSKICGRAEVVGKNSRVLGGCILTNYAFFSNSSCRGDAIIGGDAEIENNSRVSAGARIFGGYLNNVRVKRGVRINNGDFSNQTLDSSISDSNITAKETDVLSKLGIGNNSVDYYARAQQSFQALEASYTGISNLNSSIGAGETINYNSNVYFQYYTSNGKCEINLSSVSQDTWLSTSSGSVPISRSFQLDSSNRDSDYNTLISVNNDIDINNSFDDSFYTGDLVQRSYIGSELFVFNLKLKTQLNFLVSYKNIGDTSFRSSIESRNIIQFVFKSKSERDAFKSNLIEFVSTCSNI